MTKIKLFNEINLAILMKDLKSLNNNKVKSFNEHLLLKKPHCNVLTSIARLLSAREVCGCIYHTNNKIFLTTNRKVKNGQFREEISKVIYHFIQDISSDNKKISLYQIVSEILFYNMVMEDFDFIKKEILLDDETEILLKKFVINFETRIDLTNHLKTNWKNVSHIYDCQNLSKKVKKLLENETLFRSLDIRLINFRDKILRTAVYLEDIEIIINSPLETLSKFSEDNFVERYQSENNLHCEIAMLELQNKDSSLEFLAKKLQNDICFKDFTISKFCCYLCYLVFESLSKVYNNSHLDKIDFNLLGNSCIVYPSYKNLEVEKSDFSLKVKQKLDFSINELINLIKKKRYNLREKYQFFIENTNLINYFEENTESIVEKIESIIEDNVMSY